MWSVEVFFYIKYNMFGAKNLTEDEKNYFHLSTLKLSYEEAVKEYESGRDTRLGRLLANRELPIDIRRLYEKDHCCS